MSSNNASKAPPKCNQAIARLERAIARLERAAQHGSSKADPNAARLEAELAEMRQLTELVAGRLDGAIGRIRLALEN
ncbi:MAG: hypothetical protein HQL44_02665 [Alphaproteobacteria bacterium]|nr:hypothetical protein [Alphaproteobacteria bacterium]